MAGLFALAKSRERYEPHDKPSATGHAFGCLAHTVAGKSFDKVTPSIAAALEREYVFRNLVCLLTVLPFPSYAPRTPFRKRRPIVDGSLTVSTISSKSGRLLRPPDYPKGEREQS